MAFSVFARSLVSVHGSGIHCENHGFLCGRAELEGVNLVPTGQNWPIYVSVRRSAAEFSVALCALYTVDLGISGGRARLVAVESVINNILDLQAIFSGAVLPAWSPCVASARLGVGNCRQKQAEKGVRGLAVSPNVSGQHEAGPRGTVEGRVA